jgi:uncharacterized protein YqjF (DUF2071 family)
MGQTWLDLLFAHWAVEPAAVRRLIPNGLELDLFDGRAWIGITPFEVAGLHPRGLPPPPRLSRFPELNVRTYVRAVGRPGIWFFSLDAGSVLAVAAARALYGLPYFPARMDMERTGGAIGYASRRTAGPPASFSARYEPAGAPVDAAADSLEAWLTERYRLYATRAGRPWRADIHHAPWRLRRATADVDAAAMVAPLGLELHGEPHLLYAARQDVVIWPPAPLRP